VILLTPHHNRAAVSIARDRFGIPEGRACHATGQHPSTDPCVVANNWATQLVPLKVGWDIVCCEPFGIWRVLDRVVVSTVRNGENAWRSSGGTSSHRRTTVVWETAVVALHHPVHYRQEIGANSPSRAKAMSSPVSGFVGRTSQLSPWTSAMYSPPV